MSDIATMWQDLQQRWITLIETATPEQLAAKVPATPGWTPKELLAHVVGVDRDTLDGADTDGQSEKWTQGHVDARADAGVADIVAEWRAMAPEVLAFIAANPPEKTAVLVLDGFIHEQDARTLLPGGPITDDGAVPFGLTVFSGMVGGGLASTGLAPVNCREASGRRCSATASRPPPSPRLNTSCSGR
jgi:uncharacterized protein (TIGR03083 family)